MPRLVPLSTRRPGERHSLGTLSLHFDGAPCAVGCSFCYLGARREGGGHFDPERLRALLLGLEFDALAIALSAPRELPLVALAGALGRARGVPVSVTTTLALARHHADRLGSSARLSLSVDPEKGAVDTTAIYGLASTLKQRHPGLELVLLVSLATPAFAARLVDDGLLEELVALPAVDKVALNALKPPPPWCDRAFWLATLARLRPLLARALDRRLFLDCYVAARLLGLGDCPGRADLSPAPGGVAFRSCVYQPAPDLVSDEPRHLVEALAGYAVPAACPFTIL